MKKYRGKVPYPDPALNRGRGDRVTTRGTRGVPYVGRESTYGRGRGNYSQ